MNKITAEDWRFFCVFAPIFAVLFVAILEGWKLIDEVNAAIPWQEHYRHWGSDPVRAWERHEVLFPDRVALRRRIRWLSVGSLGLLAVGSSWLVLWK